MELELLATFKKRQNRFAATHHTSLCDVINHSIHHKGWGNILTIQTHTPPFLWPPLPFYWSLSFTVWPINRDEILPARTFGPQWVPLIPAFSGKLVCPSSNEPLRPPLAFAHCKKPLFCRHWLSCTTLITRFSTQLLVILGEAVEAQCCGPDGSSITAADDRCVIISWSQIKPANL